jgi:hypothetical protein
MLDMESKLTVQMIMLGGSNNCLEQIRAITSWAVRKSCLHENVSVSLSLIVSTS